ncbi:hypothetical protein ACFPM3_00910 [Streptomyces coeruleoprunus]|uniref:Integral membrane protein n=1 Tax=Streptomyces coeruleoprunus TaxID=285563 RepID=A0ABV9X7C8_9ACTN
MTPHRKIRSSPADNAGLSKPVQGGLYAAAVVLLPLLAIGGSDGFREFLDFGTGVLALVSLTASVAWALVATDRLLLTPRQRLLAQGIHRATAVASLGFLLLHGTVKVSLGHVELIGALIPFGLGVTGSAGLIGFGSLAGLLMVVAASTGALRSTLAGRGSIAARWRPLHMLAYPAWCAALIHGLYAGRPAATWVTTLYCLAVAAVAAAVAIRLLPPPVQRRLAGRVLTLIRPGAEGPAGPRDADRGRRDPLTAPLPGAADVPEAPRPHPYEPEVQWEAPSRRARRARTPGAGISAAYRAVSLGSASSSPESPTLATASPDTGAPTQDIPLAERVPMTEELPTVTDERAPRPGYWPTPSPPPPAPSPAPRSYADPQPAFTDAETAFIPAPAPTAPPTFTAPSPTPSSSAAPEQTPASAAYNITEPAAGPTPGPFRRPPAGEPWTAPAGDRP